MLFNPYIKNIGTTEINSVELRAYAVFGNGCISSSKSLMKRWALVSLQT